MTYEQTARLYDKVYGFKDYSAEVEKLRSMIAARAPRPYHTLLDVGCGTGAHLKFLQTYYQCAGIDYSPEMITVAQAKFPELPLAVGDMRTFDLGKTFDLVICLFSAIGYMQAIDDLNAAVANMARHLAPGGLLIFEGWFPPGGFNPSHLSLLTIDEPNFKLARTNRNFVRGRLSIMDMHYLINTPEGVEYLIERHEMGLFNKMEYFEAMTRCGLQPDVDSEGLIGRGLYFGLKPS
jgi:SAM-dependent methyltransferase